jgi:hypothetical protein
MEHQRGSLGRVEEAPQRQPPKHGGTLTAEPQTRASHTAGESSRCLLALCSIRASAARRLALFLPLLLGVAPEEVGGVQMGAREGWKPTSKVLFPGVRGDACSSARHPAAGMPATILSAAIDLCGGV